MHTVIAHVWLGVLVGQLEDLWISYLAVERSWVGLRILWANEQAGLRYRERRGRKRTKHGPKGWCWTKAKADNGFLDRYSTHIHCCVLVGTFTGGE